MGSAGDDEEEYLWGGASAPTFPHEISFHLDSSMEYGAMDSYPSSFLYFC